MDGLAEKPLNPGLIGRPRTAGPRADDCLQEPSPWCNDCYCHGDTLRLKERVSEDASFHFSFYFILPLSSSLHELNYRCYLALTLISVGKNPCSFVFLFRKLLVCLCSCTCRTLIIQPALVSLPPSLTCYSSSLLIHSLPFFSMRSLLLQFHFVTLFSIHSPNCFPHSHPLISHFYHYLSSAPPHPPPSFHPLLPPLPL